MVDEKLLCLGIEYKKNYQNLWKANDVYVHLLPII
jgi:hypothetical protein